MNKASELSAIKTAPSMRMMRLRTSIRQHWQFYLLVLIPLIYMFIFNYIPMLGLQIAFKQFSAVKGIWGSPWLGLKNFQRFVSAYNFNTIIWNTISISMYSIVAGFPFPIIFALLLNEIGNRTFRKTVQMVSYAPHFISTIVVVSMLHQMLSLRFGIVNNILAAIGLERINFMSEPGMFKTIYVFSGIWQGTGYKAIIYIAALSAIDPTLYEAATIDGATRFQRALHINIPSILPTAVILLIMDMGHVMNVGVDKMLAMQNSANMNVSEVVSTYVYNIGIINADFSYATAAGMFNSVINLILVLIVNYTARRLSNVSLW